MQNFSELELSKKNKNMKSLNYIQYATQLINSYIDIMPNLENQTGNTIKCFAKECALITVNEIMNGNFSDGYNHNFYLKTKEYLLNL